MNKILTVLKKIPLFWKIYAVVTGIAVISGVATLIVLWNFLSAFEQSQPDRHVKEVVAKLNDNNIESISETVEGFLSEFENKNEVKEAVVRELTSGEWAYIKKADQYTNETPVYQLKRDGKNAGTVKLKHSEKKGSFNMAEYEIDEVEFVMPDTMEYRIAVPKGASVTVNGITLSDSYISERDIECPDLSGLKDITDVPKMTAYTVKGLVKKPDIKAIGPVNNDELAVSSEKEEKAEDDTVYKNVIFAFESNKEFIEAQTERIKEVSKAYSLFANHAIGLGELSKDIIPSSPAYKYMKMVADNDIWSIGRTNGDISDLEISNCQIYSQECFACEVKFDYVVQTIIKKEKFPTHVRYVFVKKGDKYYMADFSLKK